jgi:hypothetical protein
MSDVSRRILFSCAAIGLVICLCLSAVSIAAAVYLMLG